MILLGIAAFVAGWYASELERVIRRVWRRR